MAELVIKIEPSDRLLYELRKLVDELRRARASGVPYVQPWWEVPNPPIVYCKTGSGTYVADSQGQVLWNSGV